MIRDKRPIQDRPDANQVERFAVTARALLADVEDLPERAEDFGDGVTTTTLDLLETVERLGRVTPKQRRALANMVEGVARWLDR